MKRIAVLLALSVFTVPALAQDSTEDIVEAPPSTQGSVHVAHYVGVNGEAERGAAFSFGSTLEFRVLFVRRAGLGVTLGGEFNEFHTTALGGIGPRLRLTDPSSNLDVTLGYDVRVMRLREFDILNWGPPPEEALTLAHALALRVEGRMNPSGTLRVGGYAEIGISHASLTESGTRWGSLGLSVGFGNR